MNTFYLLCSTGKITVTLLLFMKAEEKCYGPLFLWIILMFIHDVMNFLTLIRLNYEILNLDRLHYLEQVNNVWNLDDSYQNIDITLHSYIRQQIHRSRYTGFDINQNLEKEFRCLSIFIELCRLFYFVLFVYGNVVFFSDSICTLGFFLFEKYKTLLFTEKTPYYWGSSLMFLFMGYIFLAIPLLLFSVFCFCLPFILIFFLCVNSRRRAAQDREREVFNVFILFFEV